MARRLAVIDLGSNTFHLLIADKSDNHMEYIYKERAYVSLCLGGGNSINKDRIDAGLAALEKFKIILEKYKVERCRVVGTAVLRKADNSSLFIEKAEKILSLPIEVISGLKEAELIYRGAQTYKKFDPQSHVVVDVGGGSTEIIIQNNGYYDMGSFAFGIGQLQQMFHQSDPISVSVLSALKNYIFSFLEHWKKEELAGIKTLVGSAGSFEILQILFKDEIIDGEISGVMPSAWAKSKSFQIALMPHSERLKLNNIPPERLPFLSVGLAIVYSIIEFFNPEEIVVSPYALKEGVLAEM